MRGCGSVGAAFAAMRGRTSAGFDALLGKAGVGPQGRDLTHHLMLSLKEQVFAVVPISLLQILVLAIFFQMAPNDAGLQVMGLALAIVGLVFFLEGLRVSVMPMAEQLGSELPKKVPLVGTLIVAFCLGVLVTYAEPAIAALRPLGELVDPADAPYLYYIMNQQQEMLVLAIGMGVGVAAVLGTLRFIRSWSLKPMIMVVLAPTIGCACYMQWGNPDLAPLLGMSWDCGAVTTGPVTVPILLALGIGVMQSQKQKRLAKAALESSVAANAGQALEGFGIVTLASLLPVLAVELMSMVISFMHSYDEVLALATEHSNARTDDLSAIDKSPLKEVIFAVRSILPLVGALLLLTGVFLRRGPPPVHWWVSEPPVPHAPPPARDDAGAGDGEDTFDDQPPLRRITVARHTTYGGLERASMAAAAYAADLVQRGSMQPVADDSAHGNTHFKEGVDAKADVETGVEAAQAAAPKAGAKACVLGAPATCGRWLRDNLHFLTAVAAAQIGMIMFNIGLTYGFTALGDQTGTTLPAAYREVPWYDWSPKYSYAVGLILVIVVLFLLGVLATRAEPALLVLGRTVERLSNGTFTAKLLVGSVCVGVGVGLVAGSLKILYQLPLIYFILAKYTVAVALTLVTADAVTAVAWDSAGVTTGPVTVPFVLSIGIGFSKAVGGAEGFGMLTVMSVAPIISVLLVSHLRKPAAAIKNGMASSLKRIRTAKQADGAVGDISVSNASAMFAMKFGQVDISLHGGAAGADGVPGDGGAPGDGRAPDGGATGDGKAPDGGGTGALPGGEQQHAAEGKDGASSAQITAAEDAGPGAITGAEQP